MKKNLGQSNPIILDTYIDLFTKAVLEVCQLEMPKPSNIIYTEKEHSVIVRTNFSFVFLDCSNTQKMIV